MHDGITLRPARDADGEQIIALIDAAYGEYPGCILDVDGENPELRAPASHYGALGGSAWVAEQDGLVVGAAAYRPVRGPGLEVQKLYVAATVRRRGLARRLLGLIEEEARRRGAAFIELWSDTRFETAHRLYEALDYRRGAVGRTLSDRSASREYHYRKEL